MGYTIWGCHFDPEESRRKMEIEEINPELWKIFKDVIENSGFRINDDDYIEFIHKLRAIRNLPFDEQKKQIEELAEKIVLRKLNTTEVSEDFTCFSPRKCSYIQISTQ